MGMPRRTDLCWFALVLAVAPGCKVDRRQTKLQFMPDMADAPTAKEQRNYLLPPSGSVPFDHLILPAADELADWEALANPYAAHPRGDVLRAEGQKLYTWNCTACHGASGKGDGLVTGEFPTPPSLLNAINRERPDGFFAHKIRFGGPLMPSKLEGVSYDESWKVVLYLRQLQEQGDED